MEEKDFYLDELSKTHKEHFEADKKYHEYLEQFFYSEINGIKTEQKKMWNIEEYKVISEMEKELDEKQEKFRRAEAEWHSFLSRQSKSF